jgi:hypothetical protein
MFRPGGTEVIIPQLGGVAFGWPQDLLQASSLQAAVALQASEPQMCPQSLHLQGWPAIQPSLSITLSDAAKTGVRARMRRARVVWNAFMSMILERRGPRVKLHLGRVSDPSTPPAGRPEFTSSRPDLIGIPALRAVETTPCRSSCCFFFSASLLFRRPVRPPRVPSP